MRSSTSSEGPRLVRIAVPCAFSISNKQCEALHVLRGLACSACRPCATKPRAKQETRSVLCHALVVDLTFDQSENVATAVVSSSMQL